MVPYFRWYHISDCTIFQMVPYFRWYHISDGTIFQMVPYFRWYHISDCAIFQMVPYFRWYHISDGTIFQVVPYFRLCHISSKTLQLYQQCICALFLTAVPVYSSYQQLMQSRSPLFHIYYVLSGLVKFVSQNSKSDEVNRQLSPLVLQSKSLDVLNIKKKIIAFLLMVKNLNSSTSFSNKIRLIHYLRDANSIQ